MDVLNRNGSVGSMERGVLKDFDGVALGQGRLARLNEFGRKPLAPPVLHM